MRTETALTITAALVLGGCVSEYGHLRIQGSSKPVLVSSQIACEPYSSEASSLRVLVTYEQEGPLPWVQVHALHLASKAAFGPHRTSSDGSYTLLLAPGSWEVTLRLEGFIPLRTRLALPPHSACNLPLHLSLQPVHAYVTDNLHPRRPHGPA
jgi:hypothetical protein